VLSIYTPPPPPHGEIFVPMLWSKIKMMPKTISFIIRIVGSFEDTENGERNESSRAGEEIYEISRVLLIIHRSTAVVRIPNWSILVHSW
jgi:hypothetical protein